MKRALLALAAAAAVVGGLPGAAWADESSIRNVDTTAFPTVRLEVRVSGAAPDLSAFHLRENGTVVPDGKLSVRPLSQTSRPIGTVLVIDTSGSMASNGAMDQAKEAARQFVAGRGPNECLVLQCSGRAVELHAGCRRAERRHRLSAGRG
jgi:hypothetical protein